MNIHMQSEVHNLHTLVCWSDISHYQPGTHGMYVWIHLYEKGTI